MKKIYIMFFIALMCLSLTACFRYTELYKDENGQQVYRASCKKDITGCYEIAGEVCEKGFIPMEWYGKRSQTKLNDIKDNQMPDTFGIGSGRMVFRCKQ